MTEGGLRVLNSNNGSQEEQNDVHNFEIRPKPQFLNTQDQRLGSGPQKPLILNSEQNLTPVNKQSKNFEFR